MPDERTWALITAVSAPDPRGLLLVAMGGTMLLVGWLARALERRNARQDVLRAAREWHRASLAVLGKVEITRTSIDENGRRVLRIPVPNDALESLADASIELREAVDAYVAVLES